MTVLIDMDDVLECLLEAWLNYNNEKFGTHVTLEDICEWDLSKAFPGFTKEAVYAAELDASIWKTVKPMPGADEALRKLISDGHSIYVVTATMYETLQAKMDDVLFKYFPYLSWDQVIIANNKHLIKGDVLIDDGPHNLTGGEYEKILFTAPHNRFFDEKEIGAVRVSNWNEAYEEVCRIDRIRKNQIRMEGET